MSLEQRILEQDPMRGGHMPLILKDEHQEQIRKDVTGGNPDNVIVVPFRDFMTCVSKEMNLDPYKSFVVGCYCSDDILQGQKMNPMDLLFSYTLSDDKVSQEERERIKRIIGNVGPFNLGRLGGFPQGQSAIGPIYGHAPDAADLFVLVHYTHIGVLPAYKNNIHDVSWGNTLRFGQGEPESNCGAVVGAKKIVDMNKSLIEQGPTALDGLKKDFIKKGELEMWNAVSAVASLYHEYKMLPEEKQLPYITWRLRELQMERLVKLFYNPDSNMQLLVISGLLLEPTYKVEEKLMVLPIGESKFKAGMYTPSNEEQKMVLKDPLDPQRCLQ